MNIATLKTGLIDLVGWRQHSDPRAEQLVELTTTDSGLYFNDMHPLLTHENLLAVTPEDEFYEYDDFDDTKTDYAVGDIVQIPGKRYIRILVHAEAQPVTNATYWSRYYRYEQWLKEKTEAGIINALTDWFSKKIELKTARNLLENDVMFSEVGNVTETITNENKTVGFEIGTKKSKNLIFKCLGIGLQFTEAQTITVYLFESGTKTVVDSQALVYTTAGSVQWFDLTWELTSGKSYYIAYDQTALSGTAINGIANGLYSYRWGRYFQALAFNQEVGVATMWDLEENQYTFNTNYGMNLRFAVHCDYTNFIIDQRDLFKTAISKRVAIDLLRELIYNANARVNRKESNIDVQKLMFDVDGPSEATRGNNRSLSAQYEQALNSIHFDLTGIDSVCLPCRKRGVKYGAV